MNTTYLLTAITHISVSFSRDVQGQAVLGQIVFESGDTPVGPGQGGCVR